MGVLKTDGTPFISGVDDPADVNLTTLLRSPEPVPSVDGLNYEALYQGALAKLRAVKAVGKEFARSGNPARKAAGEAILKELG